MVKMMGYGGKLSNFSPLTTTLYQPTASEMVSLRMLPLTPARILLQLNLPVVSRISKAALAGPDQSHDPCCRAVAHAQLRLPAGDRLQRAEGPPQPLPLLVVPAAAAEAGSAPEAAPEVLTQV